MADKRYITLKHIDDGWAIVGYFASAIEATDQQENMTRTDESVATAVYDQRKRTLVSYNIPKGSPLEALLKFAILQIEANLANKDNPPGIVTL